MIRENVSLKNYNTFGIDSQARYFAEVNTEEELRSVLSQNLEKPLLVLGGGSNMLLTKDFEGLVIRINLKGIEKIKETADAVYVKAAAGEVWHSFVQYCIENGFAGVENLSLIPGFVGASPMQNIGAYGVEIKDVFEELSAIEIETGENRIFHLAECNFGYRNSIFKNEVKGKYIITSVTYKLQKQAHLNTSYGAIEQELKEMGVSNPGIKEVSAAVCNIRRSKLPDPAVIGNAGSFFKNPEISEDTFENLKQNYPTIVGYKTVHGVKVAAGWLIEQSGWKGKKIGHAGVHNKQALVLVNLGGAKGSEVLDIAKQIQQSVKQKYGIELEMEVNII